MVENESRTIVRRKERLNAYKDRVAEKKSSSGKRCRWCAYGSVGMRNSWRIDMRSHLARTRVNTTEDRMRDIHIGKSVSEAANEERPDKLRKNVRFEQEAPNASSSSTMHVSPGYLASGERLDSAGASFLCRIQVMSMMAYKFLRWMYYSTRWMDEWVVTSKKVLDWYREEDVGDLWRSELNELVENMTCLNAHKGIFLEK